MKLPFDGITIGVLSLFYAGLLTAQAVCDHKEINDNRKKYKKELDSLEEPEEIVFTEVEHE